MNNIFISQTKSRGKRKMPQQRWAHSLGTRFQERKLRGRDTCFLKLKIPVLFLIKLHIFEFCWQSRVSVAQLRGKKALVSLNDDF